MTRVSKQKLEKDAFIKLLNGFATAVVETKTRRRAHRLLGELLTPAEQVVLAKRLAIIFMLLEDVSPYYVAEVLKVSTSTTQRIRRQLQAREYPYLTEVFERQRNREAFWKQFEDIIRLGMPAVGKHRWQWLDEFDEKYKRKKG